MSNTDESPGAGAADSSGEQEKRGSHNLRLIFESACLITAPFFDNKQGWGDVSLTFSAHHVLRDRYPELSQQELAILFAGVERYHKFRK